MTLDQPDTGVSPCQLWKITVFMTIFMTMQAIRLVLEAVACASIVNRVLTNTKHCDVWQNLVIHTT